MLKCDSNDINCATESNTQEIKPLSRWDKLNQEFNDKLNSMSDSEFEAWIDTQHKTNASKTEDDIHNNTKNYIESLIESKN